MTLLSRIGPTSTSNTVVTVKPGIAFGASYFFLIQLGWQWVESGQSKILRPELAEPKTIEIVEGKEFADQTLVLLVSDIEVAIRGIQESFRAVGQRDCELVLTAGRYFVCPTEFFVSTIEVILSEKVQEKLSLVDRLSMLLDGQVPGSYVAEILRDEKYDFWSVAHALRERGFEVNSELGVEGVPELTVSSCNPRSRLHDFDPGRKVAWTIVNL